MGEELNNSKMSCKISVEILNCFRLTLVQWENCWFIVDGISLCYMYMSVRIVEVMQFFFVSHGKVIEFCNC